jgi:hypothetical protein|tara:strand:- start:1268 stop:1897 length:630 start_codon:yes stop_codon:yes gene_type:complete
MEEDFFTQNNFTKMLDQYGYDINEHIEIKKHCQIDIDPNDFFKFMSKHWMDANTAPYKPNAHYSKITNEQLRLTQEVGYHNGNTLKRDWGKLEQHNSELKEIIGNNHLEKIGIDPKYTLVRLLCYEPGNVFPVHWDEYESWWKKFNIDATPTRYSVLINPWSWGQYLQLHTTVITNWQPGDCYIIPNKVLHCSGNGGIVPKITLTITSL